MKYGYREKVNMSFSDAVQRTKDVLAQEGFGVLTEIDVQETLKQKMDVEYDHYVILGACNPPLAHRALQAEKEIGLLLPCNVIVYEDDGNVYVSAIKPTVAMGMVDNAELKSLAQEVERKLIRVIDSLA